MILSLVAGFSHSTGCVCTAASCRITLAVDEYVAVEGVSQGFSFHLGFASSQALTYFTITSLHLSTGGPLIPTCIRLFINTEESLILFLVLMTFNMLAPLSGQAFDTGREAAASAT